MASTGGLVTREAAKTMGLDAFLSRAGSRALARGPYTLLCERWGVSVSERGRGCLKRRAAKGVGKDVEARWALDGPGFPWDPRCATVAGTPMPTRAMGRRRARRGWRYTLCHGRIRRRDGS